MTIWKFILPVEDACEIQMPRDAVIISVAAQHDEICVWALVDPKAPTVPRHFRVVGTGHPFADFQRCHFLASVQLHGGALVFHVHELFGVKETEGW